MTTPAVPHALSWAREVAAQLDTADRPRWRARAEPIGADHHALLDGPDGETLSVHTTAAPARVVITWWLPTELPAPDRADTPRRHEITLSPAKTPARAAADITRRLLPTARDALAAGRERKARDDAATARRLAQLDQLAALLNPSPGNTSRDSGPTTDRVNPSRIDPDRERVRFGDFTVTPWGKLQVLNGGEVDLEARLDHAQALAVAELLATFTRTTVPMPATHAEQMTELHDTAQPYATIPCVIAHGSSHRLVLVDPSDAAAVIKRITESVGWVASGEITNQTRVLGGREWVAVDFRVRSSTSILRRR